MTTHELEERIKKDVKKWGSCIKKCPSSKKAHISGKHRKCFKKCWKRYMTGKLE